MKMQDLQRHQNERLNDLEEEERIKSEALRQKAMQQMQEQEDEIKRLNEVILADLRNPLDVLHAFTNDSYINTLY